MEPLMKKTDGHIFLLKGSREKEDKHMAIYAQKNLKKSKKC